MRIVVFGASGGVGRWMVELGRQRGHDVLAVARHGSPVPDGETARLDVLADPLEPLLDGADAVLCALGLRRRHVWNPWSAPTSPVDLGERFAARVAPAMVAAGVSRIVAVSAAGVADSAPGMNVIIRQLVATSTIGVAYRDLARMEAVLGSAVGIEACCVRPVTLTPGEPTGRVREVDHFGSSMSIRRADVAGWCLDRLARTPFAGTPQIAEA